MKIKKILLSSLIAPTLATMPIIVSCQAKIDAPVDFATDSWETVIDVCEKGYIAFANAYINQYKVYETENEARDEIKEWIISNAQTKQTATRIIPVHFNDFTLYCKVRLIDVDHDELADGSGKAKFTFEFTDIACSYTFDAEGNVGWKDPNGNHCTLWQMLHETFIYALPQTIQNAIKTVSKPCLWRDLTTDETQMLSSDDKLFMLSLAEIDKAGYYPEWGDEGTPYAYYTANFYGDDRTEPKECFGSPSQWVLRSMSHDRISTPAISIVQAAGNILGTYIFYESGIAPAFCI